MSTLAKDRSAEYLGNGLSLQQESSDELKPPLAAPTPKLGGISFPRQDSTHDDDKEDQLMDISDITCTADEVAATTAQNDSEDKSFLEITSTNDDPYIMSTSKRERGKSPILKGLKDKGILIHGLQELFEQIQIREERESRIFIVKCSYFEIYND